MVRGLDADPHPALVGERLGRLDDPVHDVDEVDVVGVEQCGARVEPADLEQVDEQGLEAVQLGLQQLGRARGGWVEALAGVVQHVAGHPDGRERGAQLVGDVGDEAALQPAQLLELPDLALQVAGHLVERRREAGEVVLARDPQPLLQPPGGQPLGHPPGHPDRGDDLTGDQPGEPRDQDQQQCPGRDERPGHQGEGLLLLLQGEQEEERVGLTIGRQLHLRADHDPGLLGGLPVLLGEDRGVGPRGGGASLVEPPRHGRGNARGVEPARVDGAAVVEVEALATRTAEHHAEVADLAAGDDRVGEVLLLAGRVRIETGGGVEPDLGLTHLALGLGDDRVDPLVEQAVLGLLEQQPPDHAHHHCGQDQGAGHDARLDGPAPEGEGPSYARGQAPRREP